METLTKTMTLKCMGERVRTDTHLGDHVAEEAARRVGVLAILTAATVFGKTVLQVLLQPEMLAVVRSPAFGLSALYMGHSSGQIHTPLHSMYSVP